MHDRHYNLTSYKTVYYYHTLRITLQNVGIHVQQVSGAIVDPKKF